MLALLADLHWWRQMLHPGQLRTPDGGYWFWSGIGSDIGEVTIVAALFAIFRHHKCHEPWCPWPGRHAHVASGTKWCRRHMPDELRAAHPRPHALLRGRARRAAKRA